LKEYFKSSKQNESSRSRRQWRTRRGVEEVKTHGSRGLLLSAASKVKVTKALNAMEDDGGGNISLIWAGTESCLQSYPGKKKNREREYSSALTVFFFINSTHLTNNR
jgi:hypothetical protein